MEAAITAGWDAITQTFLHLYPGIRQTPYIMRR